MLCFPKLISSLPGANPPLPEHKIGIFVRFYPPKPPFSGLPSTKSRFLCQKWQFFPGFAPFRAQNQHFCAREEEKVESESVTAETLTLPANHRARFQNANNS